MASLLACASLPLPLSDRCLCSNAVPDSRVKSPIAKITDVAFFLHLQLKVHPALFRNELFSNISVALLVSRTPPPPPASPPPAQDTMSKVMPKTPEVLNKIRFPDLDFVEVYNQPPRVDDFGEDGESGFDSVSKPPQERSAKFLLVYFGMIVARVNHAVQLSY